MLLATVFPLESTIFVIPTVARREILRPHLKRGYGKTHGWLTPDGGFCNIANVYRKRQDGFHSDHFTPVGDRMSSAMVAGYDQVVYS